MTIQSNVKTSRHDLGEIRQEKSAKNGSSIVLIAIYAKRV